jgi:predicted amidohydrolase
MQDLRITLVQANQVWEDKKANFWNYEKLLLEMEETDLILLPEMFQTGFTMNTTDMAETMDGKSIAWLKEIAKKHHTAIYTSLIISDNGNYFNRGVFVKPTGEIACYDKKHRFAMAGEDLNFSAGEQECIVDYLDWKINLQVCYDLRFPESCRNSEENGSARYDLLLYVANWPDRRIAHWNALLPARAIENQCYVAAVNRVGTDATGLVYSGESAVYNELGERISNLEPDNESIEKIILSHELLMKTRERLPFLRDSKQIR